MKEVGPSSKRSTHLLPGTHLRFDPCHRALSLPPSSNALWPLGGSLALAGGQIVSTVPPGWVYGASNEAKVMHAIPVPTGHCALSKVCLLATRTSSGPQCLELAG